MTADKTWFTSLPDRWSVKAIKQCGDITLGKMLQNSLSAAGDVEAPYMRAANVQPDGVLAVEDQQSMWFGQLELATLDLRAGDVVVVEGGVGGYGRAAYLRSDLPGWGFQNSINRIRPTAGNDGRFIAYCLLAARRTGYITAYCNVVSMPHLTAEKLSAMRLPYPSFDEQRQIADYLDRETAKIDALIGKQEELIATLRERRDAVVRMAVLRGVHTSPDLTSVQTGWVADLPTHWDIVKLARHARIGSGSFLSNEDFSTMESESAHVPVVGGNGVTGYTSEPNVSTPVLAIGRVGALCGMFT